MSPMASRKFPVLSTKRLTLRAATANDVAEFQALLSIPEVTRFNNWPDAPNRTRVERALRWMAKVHASGKGCAWIIEISGSKALAGAIRFNSFEKKWRCGEIGYELHPDYSGQGPDDGSGRRRRRLRSRDLPAQPHRRLDLALATAPPTVFWKSRVFRHEGTLRQKAWFKGAFHDFRIFGRIADDAISPT